MDIRCIGERSVPITSASGYSSAKSIAQYPVPVPMSRTVAVQVSCCESREIERVQQITLPHGIRYRRKKELVVECLKEKMMCKICGVGSVAAHAARA